ncbi:hypothetical protein LR48_Vigan07g069800 [Vigna angularis]|uniref:RING-type E3 ubiquitin transferase n=1 Tax=Phaseolus angularis TaxID=3914 RepID=A0A0L9UWT9_PHAAN|nr:probable E3 ubiquitin-protein ligase RHC2A [Vigna angularis]KAG2391289.1 E3 ubiquitin-protein [Vigna angularis]KOM46994.1 hypothetical protein LR48_Vigan07g069800 [Vigna angularis]
MASHWCFRCNKFVRVWRQEMPMCPECDSGFVEEIDSSGRPVHAEPRRRRFPAAAAMYMIGHRSGNSNQIPRSSHHQHCRTANGDPSPINPVIMLRGEGSRHERGSSFDLFYDDGAGTGLRPLPPRMSEFLLGTGFDRVMDQLSNVESNSGSGRHDQHHAPASKAVVDAMPEIEINASHMVTESHCAVCKEPFELCTRAREMPCKHLYHPECILPWLAIRNSCPVCRKQLPVENEREGLERVEEEEENNVGLTIWRLPGGGFAVGRLGRREGEREVNVPLVYTEVDGGFNFNNLVMGEPRRISWSVSESRGRRRGGTFRRMFNGLFSCLRGGGVGPQRSSSSGSSRSATSTSVRASRPNMGPSSSTRRSWSMDVNGGTRPW